MITWCVYDISNDKRRRKVVKTIKAEGFLRVQYSVYLGNFNEKERGRIFEEMKVFLDFKKDSCYIFSITDNNFNKLKYIDNNLNKEDFLKEKLVSII